MKFYLLSFHLAENIFVVGVVEISFLPSFVLKNVSPTATLTWQACKYNVP